MMSSFLSLFSSSSDTDKVITSTSSKNTDSSCFDFTIEVHTDRSPQGISWEIVNVETNETIASQEEGFYTEAQTYYTHDESICLDMDNSDTCYIITVSDTSEEIYGGGVSYLSLYYFDEEYDDTYDHQTYGYGNDSETVCDLSDFYSRYGCRIGETPLWSCECGNSNVCFLEQTLLIIFYIVFCPCLSVAAVFIYTTLYCIYN